jgi:hypothetical protein
VQRWRSLVVERGGRLFVIRADRRGEHFLANGREPAWSQKRSRIAFVSSRDDIDDLYVVRPSGHGLRRLTSSSAVESQPAWSPDGRKLAYVALEGEATDLYVLDIVRGTVVRLTQDLNGEAAGLGAGGRTITFVSDRPGGPVWSIPAAGGALVPLGGPQSVDHPSWRPQISLERPPDLDQRPPQTCLSSGLRPATTSSASPRPATTSARPVDRGLASSRAAPTMRASQRVRMIGGGVHTPERRSAAIHDRSAPRALAPDGLQRTSSGGRRPPLVVADRKSGFASPTTGSGRGRILGKPRHGCSTETASNRAGALAVERARRLATPTVIPPTSTARTST